MPKPRPKPMTISRCTHIAISACNFRSSSSSSSSSTRAGALRVGFATGASGSLLTVSPTGTEPVSSIWFVSCSCWSSASSSSSSSSSMALFVTPEVMASEISSPIECCSRRRSLWGCVSGCVWTVRGESVHCVVDLVDREAGVDLLHGRARALHGIERLLVDVRRLYAVDLVL
jgi:hypothetical protein